MWLIWRDILGAFFNSFWKGPRSRPRAFRIGGEKSDSDMDWLMRVTGRARCYHLSAFLVRNVFILTRCFPEGSFVPETIKKRLDRYPG